MPKLRDVEVHVTDASGHELQEWGVQSLRGNKVSAYIKSTTDMAFRISIRPTIPYPKDLQPLGDVGRDEEWEDIDEKPRAVRGDSIITQWATRRGSLAPPEYQHGNDPHRSFRPCGRERQSRQDHRHNKRASSSRTLKREETYEVAAPFSFLATLYIDGRKEPERRLVVYLDPGNEDFKQPYGEVQFKCRLVQGYDGRLEEKFWVFKELGIETVFNRIALRDGTKGTGEEEDLIVDAMKGSGLDKEYNEGPQEQGKVGQIVVELERIMLGKPFYDKYFRAKHVAGDDEDVDMEGLSSDVAHATGLGHRKTREPEPVRVVNYYQYSPGEGPWATFRFLYRSQEQLQKFNFPGFPRIERKPLRDRRFLNKQMANLTPLSIKQQKQKMPASTEEKKPRFEDRIKEGSYQMGKSPPQYDFNDYRDSQGDASTKTREAGTKRKLSADSKQGWEDFAEQRSKTQEAPSTVVAVNESSNSSEDHYSPPDAPVGSPVQARANSPTKSGFYKPTLNPRHSAPKGSDMDILKTLSDASLALTKAKESANDKSLTPKSALLDTSFRRMRYESDADEADDEKEGSSDREGSPSDNEEQEDSDKENLHLAENDDAGLSNDLNKVSLGSKRQRGEGVDELEEGEIVENEKEKEKEGSEAGVGNGNAPTLTLTEGLADTKPLTLMETGMAKEEQELEALNKRVAEKEEQLAKRVKS
ncbi:MAG: hypothetical protein Q9201_000880 [Fulgogasparrea decipioides]